MATDNIPFVTHVVTVLKMKPSNHHYVLFLSSGDNKRLGIQFENIVVLIMRSGYECYQTSKTVNHSSKRFKTSQEPSVTSKLMQSLQMNKQLTSVDDFRLTVP